MTTKLDPADYWQLRTLTADLQRDELAVALAQSRFEATRTRRQACWTALATQYGLDAGKPYAASDDTCTLAEATPSGELVTK